MTRKIIILLIAAIIISVPLEAARKTPQQIRQELLVKVQKKFDPFIQPIKGRDLQIDWTTCKVMVKTKAEMSGMEQADFDTAIDETSLEAVKTADKVINSATAGPGVKLGKIKMKHDDIADILLPVKQSVNEKTKVLTAWYGVDVFGQEGLIGAKKAKVNKTRSRFTYVGDGSCDGVVIDARRSGFQPAATLTVVTQNRQTVFAYDMLKNAGKLEFPVAIHVYMKHTGKANPDAQSLLIRPMAKARKVVKQTGTADPKLAAQLKGVFRRPLIINADPGMKHETPGYIILANGSERELMLHSEALELFRQGKILVVTDTTYAKKR